MVLIGIIADVHSNSIALISALIDMKKLNVDFIISAGDIVGYNPFPNETIEIFKNFNIFSIRGNHDRAVISGETQSFNQYAKKAIIWTSKVILPQNLEYLKSLESKQILVIDNTKILLAHGSPYSEDDYIYPDNLFLPHMLMKHDVDMIILGHTHVQFSYKFENKRIVNPGSVGQPRDNNNSAAYAIFITQSRKLIFKRVKYDINKVIKEIEAVGLPIELGKRLLHGR